MIEFCDFERVRFVIHLSRHIGNGEDFQAMVNKLSFSVFKEMYREQYGEYEY